MAAVHGSGPAWDRVQSNVFSRKSETLHLVAEHAKHVFQLAPHALSMVIIVSHATVITDAVSHISGIKLVLAGILFAIWYLTKSGSEEL